MAIKVAEGIVELVADPKGIQKGLNKAERMTEEKAAKMRAAMTKAFAIGAAVTAAASAVAVMTKQVANAGDEFAKTSQRIGVSVEHLSALKHAADLSGLSFGQLSNGLRLISKRILDADNGLLEAQRSFDRLGISVKTSDGQLKDAHGIMLEIADAMGGLTTETEKVALAQELFGRSGAAMLPLLNQGADGIREMEREAERLGITWDTQTAQAAERFNDSLTRLKASTSALKKEMGTEVISVMNDFFEVVLGTRSEIQQLTGSMDGIVDSPGFQAFAKVVKSTAEIYLPILQNRKHLGMLADVFRKKNEEAAESTDWLAGALDELMRTQKATEESWQTQQDKIQAHTEKLATLKQQLLDLTQDQHMVEVDIYVREMKLDKEIAAKAMETFTDVPMPEDALLPGDVVNPEVVAEKLQLTQEQIGAFNQWAMENNQMVAESGMHGIMAMGNAMTDMMVAAGANNRALAAMEILISIMRIVAYISSAQAKTLAEMPFPANLAYYAQVASMGAQLIGTVKSLKPPKPPKIERPAFASGALFSQPTVLPAGALVAEAGEREFLSPESLMRDVVRQESAVNVTITAPDDGLINWDRFAVEYDQQVQERNLSTPGGY